MKVLIRIFAVFLIIGSCSVTAFSQFDYYKPEVIPVVPEKVVGRHEPGEMNFSLSSGLIMNPEIGVRFGAGTGFQIFLSKRLSLDADFAVSRRYFQGGPGVIAIPFWLISMSGSEIAFEDMNSLTLYLVMVVAAAMSFEHLSYHIPLQNDWELAPTVSLLRYKQLKYESPGSNFLSVNGQLSFAAGLRAEKYRGRFYFAPYIEYTVGYKDGIPGINAGAGLGYIFSYNAKKF